MVTPRNSAFGFAFFLVVLILLASNEEGKKLFAFIDLIPFGDKIGHVCLFGFLTFLCNLAFPSRNPLRFPRFMTRTTLVLLTIITLEELSRYFIPSRTMDFIDWLADVAGLMLGQTFAILAARLLTKKTLSIDPV